MSLRYFLLLAGLAAAPAARAQTTVSLGLRLGGNLASRSGTDPAVTLTSGNGTSITNAKQDYRRSALLAPQFGAVLDVRFGKLAVQPAVLFSQKGVDQRLDVTSTNTFSPGGGFFTTTTTSDQYHTVSRPNYLEIPINLVYTSGTDHGFQLFGGPYVAFGMGGRAEYTNEGSTKSSSGGFGGGSSNSYYNFSTTLFQYKDDFPGPSASLVSSSPGPYSAFPTPFVASSGFAVARRFDAGLNAGVGYRRGPLQVQLGYGLGLINQQPGKANFHRDDLPAYYQRVAQLTATYFVKTK